MRKKRTDGAHRGIAGMIKANIKHQYNNDGISSEISTLREEKRRKKEEEECQAKYFGGSLWAEDILPPRYTFSSEILHPLFFQRLPLTHLIVDREGRRRLLSYKEIIAVTQLSSSSSTGGKGQDWKGDRRRVAARKKKKNNKGCHGRFRDAADARPDQQHLLRFELRGALRSFFSISSSLPSPH
ncbi:hypothetical protein OUZ56_005152 [Daphnia magna]|uniref:Uncharacterized protein n=1 Tax=Daphnia magna TaxID=35525 RepID=A0ABQ9YSB1_9CRUS|nr:hypothetical protein OUZ56_005152 [Daphnia magna]